MASSARAADVSAAGKPDPAPRAGLARHATAGRGQRAMSGAVPPAGPAGAAPGRPSWPFRSGTVPALANGFSVRLETAPGLAAALPGRGRARPDRAEAPAASPGPAAAPHAQDWLRSSGKTQLAAAFAESLWQSGGVDLLVWAEATSRASVLSGYAAATAAVTGRDQVSSCESDAAQFLSWLGETSRPWLVVLDDLAGRRTWMACGRPGRPGAGDLRRLCGRPQRPAGRAGRAVQPA